MLGSKELDSSRLSALDLARFWSRVAVDGKSRGRHGKCWPWRGSCQSKGYGSFRLFGRTVQAHRVAYAIFNGKAPADLTIRHSCDNPPCCNPWHLIAGTNLENVLDRRARNRGGSTLTPVDVLAIRERAPHELQRTIAADYGVTQGTVSNIILRRTWSHI